MDFNSIIPFILPLTAVMAVVLSVISIFYTWHQNRLKIEVDIWIDHQEHPPLVKLCAFNSGHHPVALIKCGFIVNNKPLDIKEGFHKIELSKYKGRFSTEFHQKIDFPYSLKEGDTAIFSITAPQLESFLYYNNFLGRVKLSGYYKTAQKKIHITKPIYADFREI